VLTEMSPHIESSTRQESGITSTVGTRWRGSLPSLQQILGHATLAMIMRCSHLSPTHVREERMKARAVWPTVSEITHDGVAVA